MSRSDHPQRLSAVTVARVGIEVKVTLVLAVAAGLEAGEVLFDEYAQAFSLAAKVLTREEAYFRRSTPGEGPCQGELDADQAFLVAGCYFLGPCTGLHSVGQLLLGRKTDGCFDHTLGLQLCDLWPAQT